MHPQTTPESASSQKQDETSDWLDNICNKATTLCPVPNSLPAGAFQNEAEEDILDQVFEGIERSLSLETPVTTEQIDCRSKENLSDTEDKIKNANEDLNETTDTLDSVFERVESFTCGPTPDLSRINFVDNNEQKYSHRKGFLPTNPEDDSYVTRKEIENQGVRFRDDNASSYRPTQRTTQTKSLQGCKRKTLLLLAITMVVALIVTGIILIFKFI